MATYWHNLHVSVPADPVTVNFNPISIPLGDVLAFRLRIPGGHRGLVGVAITFGENTIVPQSGDGFYVGNKDWREFWFDDPFPGGRGWGTYTYNHGHYTHTVYVETLLDDVPGADEVLPPVVLIPVATSFTLGGGVLP